MRERQAASHSAHARDAPQTTSAYEVITGDAAQRGIPVSAVVNNAGIFKVSTVEHQTLADLEDILDVNLKGVLRLTQKWLPTLREVQGRIVMVSSVAGFMVIPRASAYCASKHALEAITDGLRVRGGGGSGGSHVPQIDGVASWPSSNRTSALSN